MALFNCSTTLYLYLLTWPNCSFLLRFTNVFLHGQIPPSTSLHEYFFNMAWFNAILIFIEGSIPLFYYAVLIFIDIIVAPFYCAILIPISILQFHFFTALNKSLLTWHGSIYLLRYTNIDWQGPTPMMSSSPTPPLNDPLGEVGLMSHPGQASSSSR